MDKPYRWGDVTPPAVLVIKKRRQYRGSQLYQTIKRGRRDKAEEGRAIDSSMPWHVELSPCPRALCPPAV